jgi:rhodanese-related sulfurtransferase
MRFSIFGGLTAGVFGATERRTIMAATGERISAQEAKQDMESGAPLVCGYDSHEKFEQHHLEGAMSLEEFQSREGSFSRDHEIIFYCA